MTKKFTNDFNPLEGKPISRIYRRETGCFLGWLYEWENGQMAPLWADHPCDDCRLEIEFPGHVTVLLRLGMLKLEDG